MKGFQDPAIMFQFKEVLVFLLHNYWYGQWDNSQAQATAAESTAKENNFF